MMKRNMLMLAAVVALAVLPLIIHHGGDAEFTGSDNQAEVVINQIRPDYKPWASPIWEPPSGEIESLLFALQAAIGAGLIGFYFGRKTSADSKPEKRLERS